MGLVYQDDLVTLYHGDCREILPSLKGISAVVTDPPYGLGFMGKEWDTLLACKKLGIKAIGIDSNEEYCEIVARRSHAVG